MIEIDFVSDSRGTVRMEGNKFWVDGNSNLIIYSNGERVGAYSQYVWTSVRVVKEPIN